MSKRFYDRYWSVKIADDNDEYLWERPDIQFEAVRTWDLKSNELTLELRNLSPDSRDFITKNKNLELVAGYVDNHGLIFKGIIEFVGHQHSGSEWITKITCRDGGVMWRQTGISVTFKKGTPISKVLDKIIERITDAPALGQQFEEINRIAKGNIKNVPTKLYPKKEPVYKQKRRPRAKNAAEFNAREREKKAAQEQKTENIKLERDKIIQGVAPQKLQILAKSYGLLAVIDEQTLSLIPADAPLEDSIIYLSPESGLIESPEPIEKGIRWTSLLQHEPKPGSQIRLYSLYYEGDFKNERVEFKGNSESNEWYVIGEAVPA
jgi:hypothetical protein